MLRDATIVQIHAHGKSISRQHQWNKCSGVIHIRTPALSEEYMQNSAHAIGSVEC